ncbi:hypothetical protein IGI04_013760 [Brassica rapa subsp. trilocularis]|uniref:Apple domain-containing protein n=1 Tax=Brassica rapa subsp. trilocularis TaxID=1813537 RepID=A0ABQ7N9Q8_BRACM|nr:hypothetical protein IGI04_013760 [Brassica rapa subsp. trilocularis]
MLPIECPSRFCNGSRCLFYVFNPINSDANYEIFNGVVSVGSILKRVVPCGLTCWKDDCNWRRRCDLKVLECLTIPESSVSGGICAERGLLGVTTCATMLEERVRSYANQQNQDSLQLVDGTS